MIPPQCPFPSTLTNNIILSDVGGPIVLLFYRSDTVRVLSIGQLRWSGYVTPCVLLFGRSVIQLHAVIFSNTFLGPPLKLFSLLITQTLQLSRCGSGFPGYPFVKINVKSYTIQLYTQICLFTKFTHRTHIKKKKKFVYYTLIFIHLYAYLYITIIDLKQDTFDTFRKGCNQ